MATAAQIEAAARVLGVPSHADAATVRRAFRAAAKRHHPDAGGDNDTFRMVHDAYEILLEVAPPAPRARRESPTAATPATSRPVRVVNAYAWAGAPTSTVGRWVDIAA